MIIPAFGGFHTPSGGGGGPATFTMGNSSSNLAGSGDLTDPATEVMGAISEGNLLIACVIDRSGGDPANHVVTDTNGGSWTHVAGLDYDNSVGGDESNTRMSFSFHYQVVSAGNDATTPTVTADDGTANGNGLLVAEFEASRAYSWAYDDGSVDGSGAADWNGTSSGSATASVDDVLVVAVAAARFSSDPPGSASDLSFSTYQDGEYYAKGGPNDGGYFIAYEADSQASGTKSTTLTATDGTGNEGVVAIAIFKG